MVACALPAGATESSASDASAPPQVELRLRARSSPREPLGLLLVSAPLPPTSWMPPARLAWCAAFLSLGLAVLGDYLAESWMHAGISADRTTVGVRGLAMISQTPSEPRRLDAPLWRRLTGPRSGPALRPGKKGPAVLFRF
jgi:hypothetical protein